jgi:histidinol-phosphate aminotransferase
MVQAERLLQGMPATAVLVLDLAYNDYASRPDRVIETPALLNDPRVVCLHTFSKLYGLAGLRVGYGLASTELWEFVNRVREPFNVNRVAQRAAAAALGDVAHQQASRLHAAQSREYYLQQAHRLGIEAILGEANFILLHTGAGRETTEALMTYGIMVRTGFPGVEDYIRVTFGTEEENQFCVESLGKILQV